MEGCFQETFVLSNSLIFASLCNRIIHFYTITGATTRQTRVLASTATSGATAELRYSAASSASTRQTNTCGWRTTSTSGTTCSCLSRVSSIHITHVSSVHLIHISSRLDGHEQSLICRYIYLIILYVKNILNLSFLFTNIGPHPYIYKG